MTEIIKTTSIHEGWLDVKLLRLKLDEGEVVDRELIDPPSGAAVLAYDPDRRVAMLISEMRPPVMIAREDRLLEVVAGAIDGQDSPIACARREAMEEAGLDLGELEMVAKVWMTPSFSTERVSLFLATYHRADRVAEGGGLDEEQEHIRTREMPLSMLDEMARTGKLPDAKTLLLVQALMLRRPQLFAL